MNGQDTTEVTPAPVRRACLVDGCACKDARILSTRRAAWFASLAASRGETANRTIAVEPSWRLPTSPALDTSRALADLDNAA